MRYKFLLLSIVFITACQHSTENYGSADSTSADVPTAAPVDSLPPGKPAVEPDEEKEIVFKDSGSVEEIIPKPYIIVTETKGELNGDGLEDLALVINDTSEWDRKMFVILLQIGNNKYRTSYAGTSCITVRYDNELEIKDRKLFVKTDHPWHGSNFATYELHYVKDDWYCFRVSSFAGDANQTWTTEMDFETGEFQFSHSIDAADEKTYQRGAEGIKPNSVPLLISDEDYDRDYGVEYKGEKYYLANRNDLWSEEEIRKMLPPEEE